jgi:hypothetical protein
MRTNLRAGSGDINELVMALKIKFLKFLPDGDQQTQVEILIETCESELARLDDLRARRVGEGGECVHSTIYSHLTIH